MRDENQTARSRSHHRQRVDSVRPTRPIAVAASHRHASPAPPRRKIETGRSRPAPAARSTRRPPVSSTRGRPVAQPRRRGRAVSRGNAQAFRKRAVSPHHPRIYTAGQSSRRLVAVFVISALLFLAVLARVTLLQTVQADALRGAGKTQRTTEQVLKAHRGTIFDRDGADLALSVPARTVIANPKLVLDPVGTVRTLTALLKLPPAKQTALTEAFTAKTNSFVYVARQIDPQLARTVVALRLAGISSISEDKRVMPSGDVGRSVVGRTDPDLQGTAGLEMEYNDALRGVDGEQSTEHDRKFRSIAGGDETVAPIPGSDIVLTARPRTAVPGREGAAAASRGTLCRRRHSDRSRRPDRRRLRKRQRAPRQQRRRRDHFCEPCSSRAPRAWVSGEGLQHLGRRERGSRHSRDDDHGPRLLDVQALQQE